MQDVLDPLAGLRSEGYMNSASVQTWYSHTILVSSGDDQVPDFWHDETVKASWALVIKFFIRVQKRP